MPKKGSTAVKVTFMTMTLVTPVTAVKFDYGAVQYRLFSFSGGTFLRGVQGNPNFFPILVQGDAVDGMSPI